MNSRALSKRAESEPSSLMTGKMREMSLAELVALAERLAGLHEVGVAPDGVDFAVVGDEAVRVGARPTREGVGREPGVHQRQRGFEIRIVEIREILGQLAGREHALVDHGAGGQAGDVVVVRAGERVGLVAVDVGVFVRHLVVVDPVGDAFADHVEFAFELHRVGDVRVFLDEHLFDGGFVAARGFAEDLADDRHGAPADEFLALLADDDFEDLHGRLALAVVQREEDQTRAVGSFRRQFDALLGHFLAQELVGHLHEDAGAVAGGRVRSAGAPVVHLGIHREGFHDDVVGALALEVGDETHAARVFFVRGVPKSLGLGPTKRGGLRDGHGIGAVDDWDKNNGKVKRIGGKPSESIRITAVYMPRIHLKSGTHGSNTRAITDETDGNLLAAPEAVKTG